jgi:hypothetical protein|tara:strand:- start:1862 stop:2218 length:357 start_codon:yes stop_codon:yes gene_type:complete
MSFKFINGITPKVVKNDFDEALDNLLENIHLDYVKWCNGNPIREDELSLKPGRKFIKIIRDNSVWGFVAKKGGVHKGIPFKTGDVFKAASWSSPAKHVRGSIFDTNTDWFAWTGPNYL